MLSGTSTSTRVAAAISLAVDTMHKPQTLTERLEAIVQVAPATVPGIDEVSISLRHRTGPPQTRAASSELVRELDLVQYETQEGPCYEAMLAPGIMLVPSVRQEQRWPGYIARALEAGVTAQMAVHLTDEAGIWAALNLYSTSREGLDPEAPGLAELFARHAGLALGRVYAEENLTNALASRKAIGQAIGIVMERYQLSESSAFAFLARVSQTGNIKLRDVAQELITQTDTRYTIKDF